MIKLLKFHAVINKDTLYNNEIDDLNLEDVNDLLAILDENITVSILALYDKEEQTIQYLAVDKINSKGNNNEY